MNNNSKNKKSKRQDLYVTVIVLLMMVAVIGAVAMSLAKNPAVIDDPTDTDADEMSGDRVPKETEAAADTEDTEDVFWGEDKDKGEESDTESDTGADTDDTKAEDTDAIADKEPQKEPLPVFVAPVKGEVIKAASLEVPVYSATMEDYRTHTGVDLYCDAGGDVAAAAKGVIKEVWSDPMMGTCISVEHSGGAVTVYKNLAETLPEGIEAGRTVEAGQIIASAGDTALLEIAEDSHVHFELSIDQKAVDPADYIDFADDAE